MNHAFICEYDYTQSSSKEGMLSLLATALAGVFIKSIRTVQDKDWDAINGTETVVVDEHNYFINKKEGAYWDYYQVCSQPGLNGETWAYFKVQ